MLRIPGEENKNKIPLTFPDVLSKSRDYNSVEYLLYTIFCYFYQLSVESKNVHNPKRCSSDLLPLLSQFYRYEYSDVKNIDKERDIIGAIPNLHHYKGCVTGIENALYLAKEDKSDPIPIPWFYNKQSNVITVILLDNIKTYKLYELLKLVIPMGTKLVFKPGFYVHASEEIQMHSWTEINPGPLRPEQQHYVTTNNKWRCIWDEKEKVYHTYVDEQISLGNPSLEVVGPLNEKGATRIGGTEVANNDTTIEEDSGNNEEKGD